MSEAGRPTRRFVMTRAAALGGAFALGFLMDCDDAEAQSSPVAPDAEINAWVVIRADNAVIVRVARSEMGQGSMTGLAQLLAEELDCDWADVRTEYVSPGKNRARNRIWRDLSTTGSRSIRGSQESMRQAGAAARLMLLEAAAELWQVSSAELTVVKGVVSHHPSRKSTTYGKLAAAAAKRAPPDFKTLKLKDEKDWTVAGQPLPRLDLVDKLDGRAIYGIDVKLTGMLSAAIKDAPALGAKVASLDQSAIATWPGVQRILQVSETAVAVVADTWWQAKTALDALSVTWTEPADAPSSASIDAFIKEGLETKDGFINHAHGDSLKAISGAAKRLEAVYSLPFLHQAPLEPLNCTARWTPEQVEVWAPTQNPDGALQAAADAAGLPIERAEVHRTEIGGSFGRRLRQDFVTKAVLIAKQIPGVPIKLIWSREEDMTNGAYRPISQCKLVGGIDDKGECVGLIMRLSGQSIVASQSSRGATPTGKDVRMFQGLYAGAGEAQLGYSIPNVYIDQAVRNTPVPVGSWRGVYCNPNAFYLECFVDEMARAAEKDAVEFRRQMMKSHPKHLAVLMAAAQRAGWSEPAPVGRQRGIAQTMSYGSYTAAVAEVSVSEAGKLTVHRVVMAIDCGRVVNPDQVTAQLEGSVAMALSALLGEEITIKNGRIVEQNFDSYELMRLEAMPQIDVLLVPSFDFWGGVGEAAVAVVAPAVLNAVFAATGKRVRTLPLKNVKFI